MNAKSVALQELFSGWEGYQLSLERALLALSDSQLEERLGEGTKTVGSIFRHIAGGRLTWLRRIAPALCEELMKQVPEWFTDKYGNRYVVEERLPQNVPELLRWLRATWQIIDKILTHWKVSDLNRTYIHNYQGTKYVVSYQWTIWRIMAHDIHHGGQLSLILDILGVAAPDLIGQGGHIVELPTFDTNKEKLLKKLRRWKMQEAEAKQLPPYFIAWDKHLLGVVEQMPTNIAELAKVEGFGPKRIEMYGKAILDILADHVPSVGSSDNEIAPDLSSPEGVRGENSLESVRKRYPLPNFSPFLVTEVTRMRNGMYCMAALDIHTGRIIRPLQPNGNNWAMDELTPEFMPGQVYHTHWKPYQHGVYPHKTEDVRVERTPKYLEAWTEAELYQALKPLAQYRLHALFGHKVIDNRYFYEGVECASLVGLLVARKNLQFVEKNGKLRLKFMDEDGIEYTLPITSDTFLSQFPDVYHVDAANRWLERLPQDTEILLRIGLTRPYAGENGEYQPKRCYLQVNGMLIP